MLRATPPAAATEIDAVQKKYQKWFRFKNYCSISLCSSGGKRRSLVGQEQSSWRTSVRGAHRFAARGQNGAERRSDGVGAKVAVNLCLPSREIDYG